MWSDMVFLLRTQQTFTSFRKAARRISWMLVSQVRSCHWCWWGIRVATGMDTFASNRKCLSSWSCISPVILTKTWRWTWAFTWQGRQAASYCHSSAHTGSSTRLPECCSTELRTSVSNTRQTTGTSSFSPSGRRTCSARTRWDQYLDR